VIGAFFHTTGISIDVLRQSLADFAAHLKEVVYSVVKDPISVGWEDR
jgi:hypothetical protein